MKPLVLDELIELDGECSFGVTVQHSRAAISAFQSHPDVFVDIITFTKRRANVMFWFFM